MMLQHELTYLESSEQQKLNRSETNLELDGSVSFMVSYKGSLLLETENSQQRKCYFVSHYLATRSPALYRRGYNGTNSGYYEGLSILTGINVLSGTLLGLLRVVVKGCL